MRTTIEIDRDLLEEAVRVTGAATKSVAVRLGSESAGGRGGPPTVGGATREGGLYVRWAPWSSSSRSRRGLIHAYRPTASSSTCGATLSSSRLTFRAASSWRSAARIIAASSSGD